MKYFEKGHIYSYEDIETILKDAKKYVVEDLKNKHNEEESDAVTNMLFELQTYSLLSLYQCLLLKGKEEE